MSTKDRLEKLKKLFSFKHITGFKQREDFVLSPELEKELSADAPISSRVRLLRDLTENVTSHSIDDKGVTRLWVLLKDLFQPGNSKESRHTVFIFFSTLIQDKHDQLGIMRSKFFDVIKNHNIPEDVGPRLELFQRLTSNGRYLNDFEWEVGSFLLEWMPSVLEAGLALDILNTLVNVFKYNVSYIDEPVVAGLVQLVCQECCVSPEEKVVFACLEVLHTAVCYPSLPSECLFVFIATLCRTVNLEVYCPTSWKIMKNLLGTHLGHSSLFTMCRLLKEDGSLSDAGLLRGAVFYITMALWGGNNRVLALRSTPSAVLPSFKAALRCGHPLVMYEVVLSIQRLIQSHGHELLFPAWTNVLDVISTIANHLDEEGIINGAGSPCLKEVSNNLHDTLTLIEHLIDKGQFDGSIPSVFQIIKYCSARRPEASVLRLMSHLAGNYDGLKSTNNNDSIASFVSRFYRNDPRPKIRCEALSILSSIFGYNRLIYEDEVISEVLVTFKDVACEPDISVRVGAVKLIVDIVHNCQPKYVLSLLGILEKMVSRAMIVKEPVDSEERGADMKLAAHGLIQVLGKYLYTKEANIVVTAYTILCNHLIRHYANTSFLVAVTSIRYLMLEWLLSLRADVKCRIGLKGDSGRFSMHLATTAAPAPEVALLSIKPAIDALATAILYELDWKVLLLVLQELPSFLKNKALLVSKSGSEVNEIAKALCAMVSDKSVCSPERLKNTPPSFKRSELQNYVFPVLASLVSYHAHLEPTLQQKIVKCLECGLASKSASQCVLALTTCTLEMRDTMVKLLPEVLLNLSKISDTVIIAIHILEFLSTLTQLPAVFANFVGDQYMAVFAISLPYTNPLRYTHYTVSLAHHVIAAWFLKCRLPFRRDFVKFIIHSLKSNVKFDEGQPIVNEDSSNRKRSSSLTEQGSSLASRRRERAPRIDLKASTSQDENNPLHAFHSDLTETCIDLMSMYSFSNVSPLPKRLSSAEMILSEGQSMSWLVANKIVTVTTSGCTLKPLKSGLCDHCYQTCRNHPETPVIQDQFQDEKMKSLSMAFQNTDDDTDTSESAKLDFKNGAKRDRNTCSCWCQGWAEILIRRPTGVISWMMRVENENYGSLVDFYQGDVSSLFLPKPKNVPSGKWDNMCQGDRICSEPVSIPVSPIKRSNTYSEYDDIEFEINGRSRNPVRRSNSSPEMSASWKSPLSSNQSDDSSNQSNSGNSADIKKKANYSKDNRLNCEAIPEEMGTTPPTCEALMLAPMDLRSVDSKPPVVPRMGSGDSATTGQGSQNLSTQSQPATYGKVRCYTISVMSPVRKPGLTREREIRPPSPRPTHRSGLNPASVFLQLYHSSHFSANERPILLSQKDQKSLKNLDWIHPFEIHKISVLYVGPGQSKCETKILKNQYGSVRYAEFLQRLGTLINLSKTDSKTVYLGGLQTDGNDGKFTYIWHDDIMQVVFHVATLMPNVPSDPHANQKKTHIGNNHVHIIYNDSGEEYSLQTLKAQFNYAVIVVEPLDFGSNVISIKAKEELMQHICHNEYKIVSDQSVAILARQLAIHANLAARITSTKKVEPYASNWLERLRWIKRVQNRLAAESRLTVDADRQRLPHTVKRPTLSTADDFTDYTMHKQNKLGNI